MMDLRRLTRALNTGGRVVAPAVRLDAGMLLEEARRQTGLEDFGEPAVEEPLRRLIHSYEHEAGLTLIGRIAARQDTLRLLTNRLKMEADRRRHPEIAAVEVRRPLFVTGLPRTGTTLLHGLLAQDPANRAPCNWESMFPSPPPDRARHRRDPRIAWAERQLRWFYRLNPDFRKIHLLGARLPEECLIITSHSFLSFQFQTSHRVPGYQHWLEAQDLRPSYEAHRHFLQHLQWRHPAERWVLKAPAHLYGIRALFATYPDAGIILTHRDPLEVVPSMASLHATLRSTFSDAIDPAETGAEATSRWAEGIRRALAERDSGAVPADRFLDVMYTDLVRDPLAAVRRVYRYYDLPFTDAVEGRMRRFLAENPKDKHGAHRYTLEQFGLDRDVELARYRSYRERFGL
jgi:Sulfotransferase family